MRNAVVLMTALVPTEGHRALVEFASHFCWEGTVHVIISGRSFEPTKVKDRVAAFNQQFKGHGNVKVYQHFDDYAPQNPSTPEEWGYWKRVVRDRTYMYAPLTHFIASETYGLQMAELLNLEFVPFNIDRSILSVKGTNVRQQIYRTKTLKDVMPEFRRYLQRKITIFGQESCGKTTFTKDLAHNMHMPWVPEFARPYLEMMDDKTITDEKMANIVAGQYAIQTAAEISTSSYIIQDTDLLSTIGYYQIYNGNSQGTDIEYLFNISKSDLYLVCPDNIPFEVDDLRYGGHERESTMQFWIDLLEQYDCEYRVLTSMSRHERIEEGYDIISEYHEKWFGPLNSFQRE